MTFSPSLDSWIKNKIFHQKTLKFDKSKLKSTKHLNSVPALMIFNFCRVNEKNYFFVFVESNQI